MKQEDWKGLGASVAIHVVLLLLFALTASTAEPQLPGMIEVEFGRFEVAAAPARSEIQRATPAQTEPRPQPEPQTATRQPQSTQSPRLPTVRETPVPEAVPPPSPERNQPNPQGRNEPRSPAAQPAQRDEAGGRPDAETGTTSAAIDGGDAAARRAPFDIEGLQDRNVMYYPLPNNPGARGTSVIAVCIGADGGVTTARPAMRTGTPSLDNAALQAVRRWRFNPLPPAAPQSEQCGRVTFSFTLS
jgi:periplasmic protein TonB